MLNVLTHFPPPWRVEEPGPHAVAVLDANDWELMRLVYATPEGRAAAVELCRLIAAAPDLRKVLLGIIAWQRHSCAECEHGCPYAEAQAVLDSLETEAARAA